MNPGWTGRLKIPIHQVAKTTDDFEARRFAEDLYYRLEEKARRSEPINSATFRRVFLPSGQGARRRASGSDGEIRERQCQASRDLGSQYFADTTMDRVTEGKLTSNNASTDTLWTFTVRRNTATRGQ